MRLETRHTPRRPETGKQPPNTQPRRSPVPYFRLFVVWIVLLGAALKEAVNLYQLQVVQGPELQQKALKQRQIQMQPFIPRRPVVDRNGDVLAIDRLVYTLWAHPKLFKASKEAIATQLSANLNRPSSELVQQFNTRDSGIRIAPALPEDIATQIAKLHINGLELIQNSSRLYPQQNLDASVVGYVDLNRHGQAGVEYGQNKWLERPVQTLQLTKKGNGALSSDQIPEGFVHFDDVRLQLTLDNRLQRAASLALRQQMEHYGAKRGSVIVMDARDGSILTMVSEPSYDPNNYGKFDLKLLKNWAVSDVYEPGSTFKPLNVAIALETGAIKPNTVFNDPGQIKVGGWAIHNAEGEHQGSLSIAQILQYSSNVGMVQVIQQMKPADYYSWLKRLGLGQIVGIDLPSEARSQLKSQQQFINSPIESATASFGQGFSLTPMQLVQLHGALANGGKLVTPHVIQGLFDSKGQVYWKPTLPQPRQVFSPATTQTVLKMMESVVKEGTGQPAQIPGYRIAGKTGTAQMASSHGGYSNAQITSFVGIVPVESPRYVVLAVVDQAKGNFFGSVVAAPVVKSVMEALLTIEQIPPSQPIVQATPSPAPK